MATPKSIRKQERQSDAVFFVPNDEEGREFLRLAHKFINHDVYTRHSIKRPPNSNSVPVKWWAVYLLTKIERVHYEAVCPACGGDYFRRDWQGTWRIEHTCTKCQVGEGKVTVIEDQPIRHENVAPTHRKAANEEQYDFEERTGAA